jgi:hypothetical protein
MMAANALQAVAQAAAAALVLAGRAEVWELVVLAAARGVGYAFYFPAEAGLLPQTGPADQRSAANAMDRIGRAPARSNPFCCLRCQVVSGFSSPAARTAVWPA